MNPRKTMIRVVAGLLGVGFTLSVSAAEPVSMQGHIAAELRTVVQPISDALVLAHMGNSGTLHFEENGHPMENASGDCDSIILVLSGQVEKIHFSLFAGGDAKKSNVAFSHPNCGHCRVDSQWSRPKRAMQCQTHLAV